jgi:hypothetical protein
MNDKPRRSIFRFSLRSLLVVVTLVACWLGWESSVVRHRKAVRQEASKTLAFQFLTAREWLERWSPTTTAPPRVASVRLVRRWLGDEAIQTIEYNKRYGNVTDDELARLKRTFPEAEVREVDIPLEPCHPGCFPHGTLVLTPAGPRAIENVKAGDEVVAFLPSGERSTRQVQSVFVTKNRLWRVTTEAGALLTTETQPLSLAAGQFRAAGELAPGDTILRYEEGAGVPTNVLGVTQTERIEQVINLVLGDREAFVAGGYLARSKPPPEVATR